MPLPSGIITLGDNKGGHVRAYLLEDGTLTDTLSEENASALLSQLLAIGKSHLDIKRIVLTHAHASHIKGAFALEQLTGAPVLAHEWEIPIIEGDRKAAKVGFPKWSERPRHPIVWALQTGLALERGRHRPCLVDGRLRDGDRIGPLIVVHTPGHTPGHCGFLYEELGIVFGGDIINTWPGDGPENKPCPWDGFTLDRSDNQRSINKLADLSGVKVLCPGHGDPVENAEQIIKELEK